MQDRSRTKLNRRTYLTIHGYWVNRMKAPRALDVQ